MAGTARSSPIPRRPMPIAAPAGRKRTTSSSGWSTRRRPSSTSIRSNCAGESHQEEQMPYQTYRHRCTTAAISPRLPPRRAGGRLGWLQGAPAAVEQAAASCAASAAACSSSLRAAAACQRTRSLCCSRRTAHRPAQRRRLERAGSRDRLSGDGGAVARAFDAERISRSRRSVRAELIGNPSIGSRSGMSQGSAFKLAADVVIEKAKNLAAKALEANADDIDVRRRRLHHCRHRSPMTMTRVLDRHARMPHPLDTIAERRLARLSERRPCGRVEIDADTGAVEVLRYTAVDDVGTLINRRWPKARSSAASCRAPARSSANTATTIPPMDNC